MAVICVLSILTAVTSVRTIHPHEFESCIRKENTTRQERKTVFQGVNRMLPPSDLE